MKLLFENNNTKYEVKDLEDLESIYYAIQQGLMAMGYPRESAKQLITEIKEDEE